MSVYISWQGNDRDVKNKIVEKLKEVLEPEVEIWDSDIDCASDFSVECIDAIGRSEVFVLILSDAAMKPSYVINEVIEARRLEMQGKLDIVLFKITDSPMTTMFAANLNHISGADYVSRVEGDDSGYDEVAIKVKNLLERRKNG